MRTSLFSEGEVAGGLPGELGSIRGEDRKVPLDLCHFTNPKTSLLVPTLSILSLKNESLALRMTRRKSFFEILSSSELILDLEVILYRMRASLHDLSHQGLPFL